MSKDVVDVVGEALGRAARDAVKNAATTARKRARGQMSGLTGVAAGAGLATLTPLLGKGAKNLVKNMVSDGAEPLKQAGGKVTGALSGGLPDALSGGLPDALSGGGSDGGGKSKGQPGVGKGRRMPIQQDIDIGVPLQTVYNQFTQFEDWPQFMHRVQRVSQDDETHVTFKTKIWGISKEFKAEIVEQRPDERIKWRVVEGLTHNGVVTFHELAPRLTRVEVSLDVEPGSLLEKAARGMRHIKRAVRADLARFKAYVLMEEEESGAWRGEVEDAEVKPQRRSSGGGRGSSNGGGGRSGSNRGGSGSSRSRSASSRSKATSSRSRSTSGRSGSSSGRGKSTSGRSGSSSGRSKSSSGRSGSTSGRSKSTSGRSGSTSARGKSTSGQSGSTSGRSRSASSRSRSTSSRSGSSSNGSGSTSGRSRSSSSRSGSTRSRGSSSNGRGSSSRSGGARSSRSRSGTRS